MSVANLAQSKALNQEELTSIAGSWQCVFKSLIQMSLALEVQETHYKA